ncbi:hypothetical protein BKA70DRAFT_1562720 [Coprinopsis sp. MPI-PUGE-AT-0042]|nr:hypothetical protein BKA70DRAFT_1562720 [Coprinopsis sp. MPI-PUGE-AT-0042]
MKLLPFLDPAVMEQSPSDAPPPAYGATGTKSVPANAIDQPPQYTFPTSFRVDGKQTEGVLVTLAQIKGHLALLNAFADLKRAVATCQDPIPQMPADAEKRWAWFVNLAAERFDRWVRTLKEEDKELPMDTALPPIDILMVWHAYMLNPRWYAEDAMRIPSLKTLFDIGNVCMKLMDHFPEILSCPPSTARVNHFAHRMAVPFDGLISASHLTKKVIPCPYCCTRLSVPYMEEGGTGYFQVNFAATCPDQKCGKAFTKEQLRARKLAENLASLTSLPGTVLTNSPVADKEAERDIKANFSQPSNPASSQKILENSDYSLAKMRAQAGRSVMIGNRVARVMSAHLEPMIYSVELAGAVMRQGSFVGKMENFGWTRPGFFDKPEDEAALQHALARYHAFLDLMASSPASFFVPTLDIDLVWHTHQLFADRYRTHCDIYVAKFVDHDDKVDTFRLSNAFDITCKAWKSRFGIEYTYCGCPLPGETIGQRLSRFLAKKASEPPSHLSPPARGDFRAATHASEHNGVMFSPQNDRVHSDTMRRYNTHQAKMKKRSEKEKKRQERGKNDDYDHNVAFLYPVPIFYPMGGLGCVATQAGVVNHGGACGSGGGQCLGGACSGGGCGGGGGGGSAGGDSGGGGCGGGCGGCGG